MRMAAATATSTAVTTAMARHRLQAFLLLLVLELCSQGAHAVRETQPRALLNRRNVVRVGLRSLIEAQLHVGTNCGGTCGKKGHYCVWRKSVVKENGVSSGCCECCTNVAPVCPPTHISGNDVEYEWNSPNYPAECFDKCANVKNKYGGNFVSNVPRNCPLPQAENDKKCAAFGPSKKKKAKEWNLYGNGWAQCNQKQGKMDAYSYVCPMYACIDKSYPWQCMSPLSDADETGLPAGICAADYGTPVGGPVCCGQEETGVLSSTAYVCPAGYPVCEGYVYNSHYGNCVKAAPTPKPTPKPTPEAISKVPTVQPSTLRTGTPTTATVAPTAAPTHRGTPSFDEAKYMKPVDCQQYLFWQANNHSVTLNECRQGCQTRPQCNSFFSAYNGHDCQLYTAVCDATRTNYAHNVYGTIV